MSSDLIVPTPDLQKASFLSFFLIKTFHEFYKNAIEYFSA